MLKRIAIMSQKSIMSFFKVPKSSSQLIGKSPSKKTLSISDEPNASKSEKPIEKNTDNLNIESPEKPIDKNTDNLNKESPEKPIEKNTDILNIESPEKPTEEIVLSPYGHKIPLRKTAIRKPVAPLAFSDHHNSPSRSNDDLKQTVRTLDGNNRLPLQEIDPLALSDHQNEITMETADLSVQNTVLGLDSSVAKKSENKGTTVAGLGALLRGDVSVASDAKNTQVVNDSLMDVDTPALTMRNDDESAIKDSLICSDVAGTKTTSGKDRAVTGKDKSSLKGKKRVYLSSDDEVDVGNTVKASGRGGKKDAIVKRCPMVMSFSDEGESGEKPARESEIKETNDCEDRSVGKRESESRKMGQSNGESERKKSGGLESESKKSGSLQSERESKKSGNLESESVGVKKKKTKAADKNKKKEIKVESPEKIKKAESESPIKICEDSKMETETLDSHAQETKPTKMHSFFADRGTHSSSKNKNIPDSKNRHESGQSQADSKNRLEAGQSQADSKNKLEAGQSQADSKNKLEAGQSQNDSKIPTNRNQVNQMVDDLNFDPAKNNYNPIKDACWKIGESVPYIALAKTFEKIEATSARLRSIEILSNLFRSIMETTPNDLIFATYLCLNRVAPAYEGMELGIGDTLLLKVIAQAAGRSMDKLKIDVQEKGDIGLIAEASRTTQKTMFTPKHLTIQYVFNKLKQLTAMSGNSVMTKKVDTIKGMYVACRQSEAKYLMRSLSGKLRIGLAEQSVLHALSQAVASGNHPGLSGDALKKRVEETALIVKTTYCNCPNYDMLIPALLSSPLSELSKICKLTPGIPLKPMLAHPTKRIGEVLDRFGDSEFVCEYKYDGERAQIHLLSDGTVQVYSRNQENNTAKYPDIVRRIRNACTTYLVDADGVRVPRNENMEICENTGAKNALEHNVGNLVNADLNIGNITNAGSDIVNLASADANIWNLVNAGEEIGNLENADDGVGNLAHVGNIVNAGANIGNLVDAGKVTAILDCEAVAWNAVDKHILPFQVLSTRKRKDADVDDIKVQVCVFAFDLLFLNGVSLVEKPLRMRRELLRSNFKEIEGEFVFARDCITSNADQVGEFLEESVRGNCEGLMVKTLDLEATYEIAKRSRNWLKLKKDYLEGVGDTLDLVVIGGYHGSGKRTGKYGGFLLACYDEENEEFQSICKIGTGLTDSDLEIHTNFFKGHVLNGPRSYYRYNAAHEPDHWFDAVQVWEVKAADLSLSPTHFAAIGLVEPDKGISLRFPRFLKIREDKKVEGSTSSRQVASMYSNQDQIINQLKNKSKADDPELSEDFY